MKKNPYFLWPAIVILLLPACQATPSTTPVSVRPDPTSTPAASPGPNYLPTPTSIVSDQVVVDSYTHPTGQFSIDYPANWQFSERPDGVVFVEPGDQGGYSVFFTDVGQSYSASELKQYLVTFVAENFINKGSGFSVIGQEKEVNDTPQAQFTTLDPKLGQMVNEVQVLQADTIVFVVLISTTQEQWEISEVKLQSLAKSLIPLDTTPPVDASPTEEPPVWILVGPASNQFAFFYPSDWQILRQEENEVAVAMPNSEIVFEAGVFAWPGADDDPAAAEKAVQAYLTNISKKYTDVESLPPAEFPLDTITAGATIDFLYTTQKDTAMAGSVITAASEGKMYRIVFTAPAQFYEFALQWFNPMYKSFKILSPEELIRE
ncbi:MAG: hypothetical protein JW953_16375 [Anaerolineae bacterium]|nr:hypothetical protein [Anaerolineae bacterium]